MSYEPLHHKYRPQTFSDLVGQEAIATTLTNAILTQKIAPAYLFTGPRGTGKTSSARILAKSLNCLKDNTPTEQPCGVCDVCQGIAKGSTLDVIEIDAASNTGVDNIRELIERAQFAPVQCRYKVYVVDECLTGDSLVLSDRGLVRIDDPSIKGKKVLSYNDSSQKWEFKKVVRWLDQGERQTLIIKTTNREIQCTGNHLVRTEQGWIPAKDVKEGTKILSPVNKDSLLKKTKLLLVGLQQSVIQQKQSSIQGVTQAKPTTTRTWAQTQLEPGYQNLNNIQSHQWITNLEMVESVKVGGVERVYDIEVLGNHNFVANGLLVHNCHMLSTAAFNALLKTLEEPPEHVVFVLATTDPQRVLPTIISRCQRFDFRRIAIEAMVQHLSAIASIEKISITPEAVHLIASFAQGGLRDAESLLDQLSLLSGQVTVERVWDLVGSVAEPDLLELLQAIAQNNPEALLDCTRRIMDRGKEPLTLLQNLASFYRDLLIAKTASNRSDLVTITPHSWKALCEQAKTWEVSSILAGQQHLAKSEVQIKTTTQPRLWLEVTLLGLLPANSIQPSTSPTQTQHVQQVPKNQPQTGQEIDPPAHQPAPPSQTVNAAENVPASIQPETQSLVKQVEQSAPVPAHAGAVENIPAKSESINVANSVEIPSEQWQQVLAHLQPNSTQALLRQMGHLIEFNGKVARIGMRSKAWCNQAKAYVPNIKAAFKATFNQEVEVKLELATATQTNSTPIKESPVNDRASDPVAPPPVNQSIASQIAATASDRVQAITQLQPETTLKESTAEQTAPNMDVVDNAATASAQWDEREVAIAAQRLADFFNGEVVLKDDATFVQPTATTNLMPPLDSDLYNVDAEGDVDIDF